MRKKKDPNAVALGRKGGKARMKTMTPEQRKARASHAARSRYGKVWYGLFADDPYSPEKVSRDKTELSERALAEPDRRFTIEPLDYDPENNGKRKAQETRIPIVAKFEPDTAARLQALDALKHLDADAGKRGRS